MPEPVRRTVLRTVVIYIAAFGIATLALGECVYLYARHELVRRLDVKLEGRMAELERVFAARGQAGLLRTIDSYADHGARTFGYVLTDARGVRVRRLDDVPRLAPGWGLVGFEDRDDGRVDPARTLTRRLADGSTLTILADRDFVEQYDAVTVGFLFASLALLFMFAAGGALSLERTVRRRIAGLNDTARAIFEGDLEHRVPISSAQDEFDAIAGTVNAMLDQLSRMLAEVRRVSAYIAHDLREPIVRLRDHLQEGAGQTGIVDLEAVERCEDIIRLFGAILRIGEIDGAMIATTAIDMDLSELVAELSDAHVAVAEDLGRSLQHDVAPGIRLTGDRDLLAQLLINLIDNALRHTPPGSHVSVALSRVGEHALLSVADNGPSLSDADRQRLADRRRRGAVAGKRDGFGLKLAHVIALGHQGRLTLLDNRPGLRVEVELPLRLAPRARGTAPQTIAAA